MTDTLTQTLPTTRRTDPVGLANRVLDRLNTIPAGAISLVARIGVAGLFWRSGQTKVEGFSVTDSALYLFREEYALPLVPPEVAAHMAALAEHLLPALLVIGLASRFSAAGLLAMTAVIQVFVYPGSWPDHFTWAAALLFLVARGPGILSLDHLIARRFRRERS